MESQFVLCCNINSLKRFVPNVVRLLQKTLINKNKKKNHSSNTLQWHVDLLVVHPTRTVGKSLKVWFGVAPLHTATSNCTYAHINTPLMQGHASSHGNGKQVGVRRVDTRTEKHGRWHHRERLVSVQLSTAATGQLFYFPVHLRYRNGSDTQWIIHTTHLRNQNWFDWILQLDCDWIPQTRYKVNVT